MMAICRTICRTDPSQNSISGVEAWSGRLFEAVCYSARWINLLKTGWTRCMPCLRYTTTALVRHYNKNKYIYTYTIHVQAVTAVLMICTIKSGPTAMISPIITQAISHEVGTRVGTRPLK